MSPENLKEFSRTPSSICLASNLTKHLLDELQGPYIRYISRRGGLADVDVVHPVQGHEVSDAGVGRLHWHYLGDAKSINMPHADESRVG